MDFFKSNQPDYAMSDDDEHGAKKFEPVIPLKGIKSPYLQVRFSVQSYNHINLD